MFKNKINFFAILLWGIVIYSIALLTYCTMRTVFNDSADAISAFGSLLGALGAFFATIVAAYLYNDWKEAHNKNIDAQFCMKIYDFIDWANHELIMISGFIKDYSRLDEDKKVKNHEALNDHLNRLLYLSDKTTINLSNLGYFIDSEEYNSLYIPNINYIIDNLETFMDLYRSYSTGNTYKDLDAFSENVDNLMIQTRNLYRAFIVELKKYYKA